MILQLVFSIFPCPLGFAELQVCPFPDVILSPLTLSALSSSPFHCALQDGFGQTWWTGNMTTPLQFASLYDRQEVFVWSSCLLDLGTDFLVGNMVFVHILCLKMWEGMSEYICKRVSEWVSVCVCVCVCVCVDCEKIKFFYVLKRTGRP